MVVNLFSPITHLLQTHARNIIRLPLRVIVLSYLSAHYKFKWRIHQSINYFWNRSVLLSVSLRHTIPSDYLHCWTVCGRRQSCEEQIPLRTATSCPRSAGKEVRTARGVRLMHRRNLVTEHRPPFSATNTPTTPLWPLYSTIQEGICSALPTGDGWMDIDFLPDTGFGHPTPKIWPDPDWISVVNVTLKAYKRNHNYSISRPFL